MWNWQESLSPVTWSEFFRWRGIDYKGEEILTAQTVGKCKNPEL
jgi:hypothetical protein